MRQGACVKEATNFNMWCVLVVRQRREGSVNLHRFVVVSAVPRKVADEQRIGTESVDMHDCAAEIVIRAP